MVSAVDWLPTVAGFIGESKRGPTDRPIDGINVADHLLGKSDKSGREAVLYFGLDIVTGPRQSRSGTPALKRRGP